ncbi:MAG: Ku protein, partial [Tabrizicola sp.]|nr:Ku protein [Tabrizicola sp.]
MGDAEAAALGEQRADRLALRDDLGADGRAARHRDAGKALAQVGLVLHPRGHFLPDIAALAEIDAVQIESSHTLSLDSFVSKSEIEQIYIDSPYYLTPSDKISEEAFAVIRDALAAKKMAGLARMVLFRRERPVMIEALGKGMLLTTLRYDNTVRQSETAFEGIGKVKIDEEMIDLATHIIDKKKGIFDPSKFEDKYEKALLALIDAK